ncbi:P-loop ATPase, Sll1717 family [Tautonia plasticadhaerens]|uniref:KAP family P-loop domain protein n=1 Tax=Tautonia plasticadhaerens TaxID=2527974 RepID=A0A518H2K6_9BACT|nr:hypothetical protein [Tautonia plasticadhaerens]QDV35065.1 hypothetical protein ElP_29670 [Tautonia plasticadhaerens]
MVPARPSGSFKFRKNSTIGAAAAENDRHFLENCYIDTGDLDVLTDQTIAKCIVVGRTGSGKTALLLRLKETQPNVIEFSPFNLTVEFVSNSQVIRLFTEAGVNMDPFYKLLWRHVFTVELIKKIHGITDRRSQGVFFDLMKKTWSDEKKEQYDFLLKHGDSFWKEADERVKETTKKTETELKAALGGILGSAIDIGASRRWTDEQKAEIRAQGQEVVSRTKLKDLNRMFDLIKMELAEAAKYTYFIVIDDLDQQWADDSIRYKLIYALIETMQEFHHKVKNVKIAICLRTDLIERIIKQIKGAGYQEEKIRSLFLDLTWTGDQLTEMLDARINQLVRDSYTLATITHRELLPKLSRKVNDNAALEYMIERTLMRPRDLITFFNFCIGYAVGRPDITKTMLLGAEGDYSKDRRRSLEQEWKADYPDLKEFIDLFKKRPPQFRLGELTKDDLDDFVVKYTTQRTHPEGGLGHLAYQYYNEVIGDSVFRISMVSILYSIGFLGIKTDSYTSMQYVGLGQGSLDKEDISDDSLCAVHKMYWRSLGIHDRGGDRR